MDEDYFAAFRSYTIATHIQMASTLSEDQPIQVRITPCTPEEFEIAIASFDYLGLFSIFCGLLSAFALDIHTGDIFSFARGVQPSKVVDVFKVGRISGDTFD